MKRILKIAFGCLGIIIVILAFLIGIIYLVFQPSEMCGNHLIESKFSPNKQFKVIIFSRDCGATTGYSTQISIVNYDEKLEKNENGNIFIADYNHGEAKMNGEIINVNTKWLNDKTLIIEYDEKARIFKNEDSEDGINILYKKISTTANSGLAQLGFEANFKVGFVFGSWFLINAFGLLNPQLPQATGR